MTYYFEDPEPQRDWRPTYPERVEGAFFSPLERYGLLSLGWGVVIVFTAIVLALAT